MSAPPSGTKSTTPRVTSRDGELLALGRWTAAQLCTEGTYVALDEQMSAMRRFAAQGLTSQAWDLRGIERLDHVGAQVLISAWESKLPAKLQANASQRAVLERVARLSEVEPKAPRPSLIQRFERLGEQVWHLVDHTRDFVRLIGQLLIDFARAAKNPRQAPWRDLSGHLYQFGATALPITALVGFLIGVVLAYLTAQQLRQFGAGVFIVQLLGVALIRELGPVLAAVLVAGRSGSAITAQIGVMRVTEELDAMRVMGIAHGFRLVLPRAIALALVMPLIAVWTTLVALLGGMLAADLSLGITPNYFLNTLPSAVDVANLWLALVKSAVFGILIALVGCHFGLRVKPNTESLGQGTTASVVTSITVVIVVDALFAILFQRVGL